VRITDVALTGLSCPASSLCLAVDSAGQLLVSTKPQGARAAWKPADVRLGSGVSITGISCASARLCVAIDSTGDVISSTHPAARKSWTIRRVDDGGAYTNGTNLTGISCPSRSLCVAVDESGNAISSTNPAGSAPVWTAHPIDNGTDYECYHYGGTGPACVPGLTAVSCPSTGYCAAIDTAAGFLSSTNPTGAGFWGGGEQPASMAYDTLTCPSVRNCLDSELYSGQIFAGPDVGQTPINLLPAGGITGLWCRSTHLCFAAGYPTVGTAATTPTELFESLNPFAAKPVWKRTDTVRPGISAVSCPSLKVCFAADDGGAILTGAMPSTPGHRH
jgi:hypothetical protein